MARMNDSGSAGQGLLLYINRQATSPLKYIAEQSILSLFGWIPTVIGIGLRALIYRLILRMRGVAAIENGVRIRLSLIHI